MARTRLAVPQGHPAASAAGHAATASSRSAKGWKEFLLVFALTFDAPTDAVAYCSDMSAAAAARRTPAGRGGGVIHAAGGSAPVKQKYLMASSWEGQGNRAMARSRSIDGQAVRRSRGLRALSLEIATDGGALLGPSGERKVDHDLHRGRPLPAELRRRPLDGASVVGWRPRPQTSAGLPGYRSSARTVRRTSA